MVAIEYGTGGWWREGLTRKNQAIGTEAKDKETWSISEAALIGVAGFCLILTLLFLSTRAIQSYGLSSIFTKYQEREITALISVVGTALTLRPFILRIIKNRHFGGWWQSIEWNGGSYIRESIIAGTVLAMVWSLISTALRAAGSFAGSHLVLNVILYVGTEVVASAALEEMYFRGILFVALAKRYSGTISVIVTTVAFVLIHVGHWLDVLPAAMAYGIARLKTKSAASCFALHASYNLFLLVYMLAARFYSG